MITSVGCNGGDLIIVHKNRVTDGHFTKWNFEPMPLWIWQRDSFFDGCECLR